MNTTSVQMSCNDHNKNESKTTKKLLPNNDKSLNDYYNMAPQPGLEPGTHGLTVRRSTN